MRFQAEVRLTVWFESENDEPDDEELEVRVVDAIRDGNVLDMAVDDVTPDGEA